MSRIKRLEIELPLSEVVKPVGDHQTRRSALHTILFEDSIPLRALTKEDRKRIQAGLKGMGNNRARRIETKVNQGDERCRLNRCRYKGGQGMRRWVDLGVIGYTLINISCALLQKE
jgi:hypothetical protein